ncbi:MAG: sigma 54-interacting transcriptional regulator [Proteobacteria bacterium]|nr:sigma 54-interacting transcriptional regulator [Pseudomonadota bacterium]
MPKKSRLTEEQRNFFSLVSEAIYINPFSDKRQEIDLRIAGFFPEVPGPGLIEKTLEEVKARINDLEKNNGGISSYQGKDRTLVENAYLFDFFYRFRDRFDRLIKDQMATEETSIKVGFARQAIALLQSRGFDFEQIYHSIALCYQIRRAFFFIRDSLIGQSPAMKEFRRKLWNNVFTHDMSLYTRYLWNRMEDFSTLLLGETGTGKGTAAMAIGRSGYIPFDEKTQTFKESFSRSFVSLNLSQFPETLMESELFGHKKGSFTGAFEDYKGVFERCSPYGAIFLDEIGEISVPVQVKLLQVLQERVFTPVGSRMESRFQGRVIAATNRSFDEVQNRKVFRDDFFYRLCSDIITVPTLRQRIQETPGELDTLLAFSVKRMVGTESPEYTDMVREVVDRQLGPDYEWPGNVRELEQCVRRVLLNRTYTGDRKKDMGDLQAGLVSGIEEGSLDAQRLLSGYCRLLYERLKTYEEVAKRTCLDRRTVKKYILEWDN